MVPLLHSTEKMRDEGCAFGDKEGYQA